MVVAFVLDVGVILSCFLLFEEDSNCFLLLLVFSVAFNFFWLFGQCQPCPMDSNGETVASAKKAQLNRRDPAPKLAGRVINTCKSTSGYSHMVENETIRILEFSTDPQQFR